MAGFDKINYTTLERLLSSDINQDSRLRARNLMEIVRLLTATTELNSDNDAVALQALLQFVIGGLKVQPSVNGVLVSPGIMIELWSGVSGEPSDDESPWVIGQLHVDTQLNVAVPMSDTWCLIQGRPVLDVVNGTRDEWNEGTESFDPISVPYLVTNGVELNVKLGTGSQIPVPDTGWIPLAGLKRLSSGADPTSKELIDLRPLYDKQLVNVQTGGIEAYDLNLETTHYDCTADTAGDNIRFSCKMVNDLGGMFARSRGTASVDITQAAIIDPTTTLSPNTWHYLYLCQWQDGTRQHGSLPRQAYDGITHQGMLVLSHIGPTTQGARDMPSTVTLPDPFGASAKLGTCIGCLLRNPNGDGWYAEIIANNKMRLLNGNISLLVSGASPQTVGAGKVPTIARTIEINFLATSDSVVDVKNVALIMQSLYPRAALSLQGIPAIPVRGLTTTNLKFESTVSSDPISATLIGAEL